MEVVIVGFALFSLFFGAGNLIFPPFLGKIYGSNWLIASLGFILTGVGLASIAIFSMAKKSGDIKVFTEVAGKKIRIYNNLNYCFDNRTIGSNTKNWSY